MKENLLDLFAEAYNLRPSTPASKPDAEAKMFAGTPLAGTTGDPLKDPLFMEAGALSERQRIRYELEHDSTSVLGFGFSCSAGSVTDTDGKHYSARAFIERQHRTAYDLLLRGSDIREVAAQTHLTPEEVSEIKAKFNL